MTIRLWEESTGLDTKTIHAEKKMVSHVGMLPRTPCMPASINFVTEGDPLQLSDMQHVTFVFFAF